MIGAASPRGSGIWHRFRMLFSARSSWLRSTLPFLVAMAAVWPFIDLLQFYFTDPDTFRTLYSARILSWKDFWRILTHPMHSLVGPGRIYYRPVVSLSFSLDYALWGLNPFGFHLTNLVLHVLVAVLLFQLVYRLNQEDLMGGFAAGLLYPLHPLMTDVLSIVVGREEILATVFLLGGILFAWRREQRNGETTACLASVVCFILAVGAKEIAAIFVPILLILLWFSASDRGHFGLRRVRYALRRSLPYLVALILYLSWWLYVTEARAFLGGGPRIRPPVLFKGSPIATLQGVLERLDDFTIFYFRELLHPLFPEWVLPGDGGILQTSISLLEVIPDVPVSVFYLLLGITYLAFLAWIHRTAKNFDHGIVSVPSKILRGTLFLGWVLLVVFPGAVPLVESLTAFLYHGKQVDYLPGMMASRDRIPLTVYQRLYTDVLWTTLQWFVVLGGCLLAVLDPRLRGRVKGWMQPIGQVHSRMILVYGTWIVLPGIFLGLTFASGYHNLYSGLPPLAAIIATTLSDQTRFWLGATGRLPPFTGPALGTVASVWSGIGIAVCGLLVFNLSIFSPLILPYREWKAPAVTNRIYMAALEKKLRELPPESGVELRRIPYVRAPDREYPHLKRGSLAVPHRRIVKMLLPKKKLRITNRTYTYLRTKKPVVSFTLKTRAIGSHYFLIESHLDRNSNQNDRFP